MICTQNKSPSYSRFLIHERYFEDSFFLRSVPEDDIDRCTAGPGGPGGVAHGDPAQSCSPITLEYAEELLLMAYNGRCAVMDVSQVPKECPSGKM